MTAKGMIPRSELEVKDVISETDNTRCIAMEWYHNGELVKRDAWVVLYAPQNIAGEQPKLG